MNPALLTIEEGRGRKKGGVKTYLPKKEEVTRSWFLVNAKGKVLGRLASVVASILIGKHKIIFTPHIDCGDGVIVINAKDIRITGKKAEQKIYRTYSGYPSGLKEKNYETLFKAKPTKVIIIAVKSMLPKNKLGRQMIKRLKVYADDKHSHQAQAPKELNI